MRIVFRLAYLACQPVGWRGARNCGRRGAEPPSVRSPRGCARRGAKRDEWKQKTDRYRRARGRRRHGVRLLSNKTTKRRACRTVRSLSAMWIATKFRRSSSAAAFLSLEIHQADYEASVSGARLVSAASPSPFSSSHVCQRDEPRGRHRRLKCFLLFFLSFFHISRSYDATRR